MVAGLAVFAFAMGSCAANWSQGQEVRATTPIASVATPTMTPSAPTASVTPSASSSTTSTTPTPKPTTSPTTFDPTTKWAPAVSCKPGDLGNYANYHLARCKVAGKTPLQVLEICRTAARQWMARISNGKGQAKESVRHANVATCVEAFGLKYTGDYPNVEGCPLKCGNLSSREGLQYILLDGGIASEGSYNELQVVFDAKTGEVLLDDEEHLLTHWEGQFGG